ncbi:MAG: DUF3365 domain-containing protein [Gemmatimonadota bacterium]
MRVPAAWMCGAALVAGLAGCARDAGITAAERTAIETEGGAAAEALMGALQARLVAAMQEGGPAHAVRFCAQEALPVTDAVAADLGDGFELKRVSVRHRNPRNAPDAAEAEALRHFTTARGEAVSPPETWVQRTPTGEYRYYRAVTIVPPCLTCHGDPETMDPAVRTALEETYPEDLATGYEAGDFRGLIRVTVPASKVES